MSRKVAIIDYGSGNLRSAAKAFERAGEEFAVKVTNSPQDIKDASHIVLPGVGAFGDCKQGLSALVGMIDTLEEEVIKKAKPFLGICVGMQLMAKFGHEHGGAVGLSWLDAEVDRLKPQDTSLKIPHMGWNELKLTPHPLFTGLNDGVHMYFVHSYQMYCKNPATVLATCDYAGSVTAVVGKDNLLGVQFHPEKSQAAGLQLIANFLAWRA